MHWVAAAARQAEIQATFLNALVKLSFIGWKVSLVTFCAKRATGGTAFRHPVEQQSSIRNVPLRNRRHAKMLAPWPGGVWYSPRQIVRTTRTSAFVWCAPAPPFLVQVPDDVVSAVAVLRVRSYMDWVSREVLAWGWREKTSSGLNYGIANLILNTD